MLQLRHCHEQWQHTNMSQPVPTETVSWAVAAHQHVSTCSNWDTVMSSGSTPTCLTLFQLRHCHEQWQHTNMSHSTCSNWDTVMSSGSTPTCLNLFQLALQTAKSYLNMTNSLTSTHDVIWDHKSSSIFKLQALILHYSKQCAKSFNTPHYRDCSIQLHVYQGSAVAWILMHRHLVYTPNCTIISHSNFILYNEPTN